MTAAQFVNQSLSLIGVLASGETPNSDEAAAGLVVFNQLLALWSAKELTVVATRTEAISLAEDDITYAFAGARPIKILAADVVVGGMTFPVKIMGADGWAAYDDRSSKAARVRAVFCDYAFPTVSVLVAPIPAGSATLNLYCTTLLSAALSSGDSFAVPPGYEMAIRFNLAVALCPEFGRPCPPEVASLAKQYLADIEQLNASNRAGLSALEIPPVPGSGN
jgi:hypothetical protein